MLSCFGCWFWVSCWPLCRTVAGSGRGGGATMRGVPRFKITMAVGHPFIGRGSRPKVGGTPKGCPGRRPLSALRFSQAVELSTVFGSPTTGNFYRKRTTGAPYRFRGGAIYRERGGAIYREKRPWGGAIYRKWGGRFIVDKLAYPQGFSTVAACFGCLAGCFSLVTGRAPGRAHLSPKMGNAWGGAIYRDGDAGAVASSPRCRHQHDAQRCRNGMTKGIEARRGETRNEAQCAAR